MIPTPTQSSITLSILNQSQTRCLLLCFFVVFFTTLMKKKYLTAQLAETKKKKKWKTYCEEKHTLFYDLLVFRFLYCIDSATHCCEPPESNSRTVFLVLIHSLILLLLQSNIRLFSSVNLYSFTWL